MSLAVHWFQARKLLLLLQFGPGLQLVEHFCPRKHSHPDRCLLY